MSSPTQPISLPARLFLLGINLEKGKVGDKTETQKLIRAGTLAQLVLDGQVRDVHGTAVAEATAGPVDPLLADVFRQIGASSPKKWKDWFGNGADHDLDTVRRQLQDGGTIGAGSKRILGLIPTHDVAVLDRAQAEKLHAGSRDALLGETPVDQVDGYTAAAVALAGVAKLRHVVSKNDLKTHADRFEALKARIPAVTDALERALRSVRRRRAAIASAGSHGSS